MKKLKLSKYSKENIITYGLVIAVWAVMQILIKIGRAHV